MAAYGSPTAPPPALRGRAGGGGAPCSLAGQNPAAGTSKGMGRRRAASRPGAHGDAAPAHMRRGRPAGSRGPRRGGPGCPPSRPLPPVPVRGRGRAARPRVPAGGRAVCAVLLRCLGGGLAFPAGCLAVSPPASPARSLPGPPSRAPGRCRPGRLRRRRLLLRGGLSGLAGASARLGRLVGPRVARSRARWSLSAAAPVGALSLFACAALRSGPGGRTVVQCACAGSLSGHALLSYILADQRCLPWPAPPTIEQNIFILFNHACISKSSSPCALESILYK